MHHSINGQLLYTVKVLSAVVIPAQRITTADRCKKRLESREVIERQ
jgi:hypothetical protein